MSADFQRVKDIFLAALDREAGPSRSAYLSEACGQDSELRQRVEALLVRHEAAGSFLESPARAVDPYPTIDEPKDERPGMVIGPYKLLQQIGEGGMGTVFMAEQTHPVQRKVALKIIRPGMDSRQVIARFEAERQALALMDHPNIAKVLDAGTTGARGQGAGVRREGGGASSLTPDPWPLTPEEGRPYFVMELVRGVSITKYCDEHHLTPRERLELFIPVCQAVQHAHQKGIIHRDLKPSNVLVALYDGKPVPKVIDFGVNKAIGQKLTGETLFTQFGQVVGTLEYMSPEQAEPNQLDIDTRSDIYSLGVLLYELLTGTTPIQRERLKQAAILEALRIIREEEPPKPSTRLSTTEELPSIAANRGLEPKKLSRLFRGELDWVVMKALEKDRNRRYETASGFAADVQHYLHDEPVQASPPSAGYRLRKFVRRNKGPVLAATTILLVLVGGIIGTTWGMLSAKKAAKAEKQAKDNAQQSDTVTKGVLDFVENKVFGAARPKDQEGGLGYDVKLTDALKAALPFVDKSFTDRPLVEARLRMTIGNSFWYLGDRKTAIEQQEKARTLYTEHRGPDHADTLLSMYNLAYSYEAAGRTQEALKLFEETLQRRKATLGPDDPHTLASMNNVAQCLLDSSRTQEALKLFEETLQRRKATLGQDHPDTLLSMNNLGICYDTADRPHEARKLHEATLQLRRAILGPDHPDTLVSMNNLANSYSSLGRVQEELKLRKEVVPLMKAKMGPNHPYALVSMNNLAVSYSRVGEWANTLAILRETLSLRERRVKDQPGISSEQSLLALTQGQIGEAEQAQLNFTAAVQAYVRSVEILENLDQSGALKDEFSRQRLDAYRKGLTMCRKAKQAVKDLDFLLQQPSAEVPGLLDLRVRSLLKEQKLAAAVNSAVRMKERTSDKPDQLYDTACAYALCAGEAKQAKSAVAGAPSFEKLTQEAMALLKQAVANGYKDAARMRQDKDLDALREREDFQKLLTELTSEEKTK
jgi:serine/threonine protein kinase/tetratricopeptide (TPR) repeat protein